MCEPVGFYYVRIKPRLCRGAGAEEIGVHGRNIARRIDYYKSKKPGEYDPGIYTSLVGVRYKKETMKASYNVG